VLPGSMVRCCALAIAVLTFSSCGSGSGAGSARTTTSRPSSGTPSAPLQSASPAPSPNLSGLAPCKLPDRIPFPRWVPKDLPLPPGTYASKDLGQDNGYFKGLFVLNGNTTTLARFVLKEWPAVGYQLGRGDSEPGEVEDQFIKPPAVGAFKAQDQVCNPGFTLMLMIFTPDRSSLPVPGTSPQSPLGPAATPSHS
jgi:hypothetical protein